MCVANYFFTAVFWFFFSVSFLKFAGDHYFCYKKITAFNFYFYIISTLMPEFLSLEDMESILLHRDNYHHQCHRLKVSLTFKNSECYDNNNACHRSYLLIDLLQVLK